MLYKFAVLLVRIAMMFCFRMKIHGKENVPKDGGFVLAVNHRSNFDPVIAAIACPRQLTFMAKAELFKNPILGKLIKALGAFPIQRGAGDIAALKASFEIVGSGNVMLIFPEGTRVKGNKKSKAQPGVSMIAHRGRVPVVPMFIDGEYKWMHKLNVYIGEPIQTSEEYGKRMSSSQHQECADKILAVMQGLKEGK